MELKGINGVFCTVDSMKRDTELKILIGCSDTDINIIENFYSNNPYMSGLLIRKD